MKQSYSSTTRIKTLERLKTYNSCLLKKQELKKTNTFYTTYTNIR